MDKIVLDLLRATENAAITASISQGLGNANKILTDVRSSIENSIEKINFNITIKNDRFKSHPTIPSMKETHSSTNKAQYDLILAGIEGHKTCANGGQNVASFIAVGPKDSFLELPNLYMYKIAVNSDSYEAIDINETITTNIKRLARLKKKYIENTTICILDRGRHNLLIKQIRECGARIILIQDGDISASLAAATNQGIDMLVGYGGVQEGVLTAAAMKCLGGFFQGKIFYKDEIDKKKALELNIKDFEKIYEIKDLVFSNDISFVATGISKSLILNGVKFEKEGAFTYSWVANSNNKTFRKIESKHYFDYKQISLNISKTT